MCFRVIFQIRGPQRCKCKRKGVYMDTPIDKLSARDLLGPILQFITNLLGKHGPKWWQGFKKFLAKRMVSFHYDMCFDGISSSAPPMLHSFAEDLSPAAILRKLAEMNMRMGTTEELISFMGQTHNWDRITAMVFSFYGPKRIPCVVGFSANEVGEFELRIINNQETAVWKAGAKLLVFSTH